MAEKVKTYRKISLLLTHSAAFLPIAMIPFGLLVRQGLADDRYFAGDFLFILITSAYAAVTIIYLIYELTHKQNKLIDTLLLIIYHFLALLFVLLVSGFLSPFLAAWILLLVNSDIRWGRLGFLASFLALALAGGLMILIYPIQTGEQLEIVQGTFIVGAIGYVIAQIRAATVKEEEILSRTRQQELYQREQLLTLVNSMGDAVVATDETGKIKVYNSTLLSLLDTNQDIVGKKIDQILRLQDVSGQSINLIDQANRKNNIFSRTDLSHRFDDGEIIKLYINIAPIQPSYQSNTERGFILILRDITKEKTLEEQRDEFVAVVSHELRTPVTIAEGNLSNIQLMLTRGADKVMVEHAIKDAHEQIIYLAKLVNDLGTLAKAERGTEGQKEQTDLSTILAQLYNTYLNQANAKGLHFNLDAEPNLPKILTNRLYVQEIMQNLITNALKYTRQGSITLRAKNTAEGIVVEVEDTGIGISKSDQKRVFEKFYRSEDYRTRESSGTGLGLYVSKKLAENLGYKINFVSRLNVGTTFSLLIPSGSSNKNA